ncbi:aminotransferase-like domain-containing protein [Bordetella genomosp. 13]|uniref:2-aminoadipate aminotransferase n=1 Tax=Bordetella genomosp. 13 TaxID=463040 RepID=A0A1W6ZBQ6_9BORD|nr:PLP-dependent aminotransferase family protein [Bordetella genomosp. 13]ARP94692.1 2-aminoadipate aminotransferase [Bordetella genomosp. 13]
METDSLYLRLAAHYRRAILGGVLAPGDRLPSVRSLMQSHHVSLSTAVQACRRLEEEGLVEARPRSGYFVLRPRRPVLAPVREPDVSRTPDPAQYVGIHDRVSAFIARCEAMGSGSNFAMAAPPAEFFPVEALKQAMMRALRRHPEMLCSRVPPQGHPALRSVLARRALEIGVQAHPDEVIVTHGCIEALNLALRAVARPGDTIAVESPTYFGLLQVLESLGMRALEVPTRPQHGMSVDALDLALQAYPDIRAVVTIPNHHNPLGCVMPDAEKARLVALCERRGVALIEDDTYGALGDAGPPPALKAWDTTGNVIYCASMHKTLAPGMRLGWMLGGRWSRRIEMLKFAQTRPNEPLAQAAVADYMGSKSYDRHLARLRVRVRNQREEMADAIARHFPEGTRLNAPSGGMLLWVELPAGTSGTGVFERALRDGVRVAPGAMFSNSDRYDHFLRVSCAEDYTAATARAVRLLADAVAAEVPRTARAAA